LVLVERLGALGISLDDDAANRIIRRCENANSSATVEEIAHFAELKVHQLARRRDVENWAGMLIAAVPAYFDSPATELGHYRAAKEQERLRSRELAEQVLADPETSEQDREWARGVLEIRL
jgi:hypothetical protein